MTLINNQKIVENWISQDPKKPFFEKRTIRASRKNPEIVCKQDLGNRFYKFLLKLGKKRYPNQKFENLSEILCYELLCSYYPKDKIFTNKINTLKNQITGKEIVYVPDLEITDCYIEVKELKWFGTGTANEKIFATPLKYYNLTKEKNKPLKIICVAKQEYLLFNDSKLTCLGDNANSLMKNYISLCQNNNIQFYGLSELLVKRKKCEPLFD